MYKMRKRNDPFESMNKKNKNVYLDRDSGIITETDSEFEFGNHHHKQQQQSVNYIFSDDEEQQHYPKSITSDLFPSNTVSGISSPSYYTNLADKAILSVKKYLKDEEWKKVLKHKSGTTVYMLQKQEAKIEKMALFKGEYIIRGFSPQSVFYVIGMRKLWDEQFDEGKLIENLNDTTSLTYESYKSTATSKAYDMTLVEKIECSLDGEIMFACTSVETPKIPKTSGKNRNHIKLQGWVLKQLNTIPVSTKVTYITQENIRGWIPGLTKKSLARKPLVIASIDSYLTKKADRLRIQQQQQHQQKHSTNVRSGQLPPYNASSSISVSSLPPIRSPSSISIQNLAARSPSMSSLPPALRSSSTLSLTTSTAPLSILVQPPVIFQQQKYHYPLLPSPNLLDVVAEEENSSEETLPDLLHSNSSKKTILLSNPPPRISSLTLPRNSNSAAKHITFADEESPVLYRRSDSSRSYSSTSTRSSLSPNNNNSSSEDFYGITPKDPPQYSLPALPPTTNANIVVQQQYHHLSPISEQVLPFSNNSKIPPISITAAIPTRLYPPTRHRLAKKQSIEQLQAYASSDLTQDWKPLCERNSTQIYTQTTASSVFPIMRSECTLFGSYTPEQICSVIQCFGARKVWDDLFQDGQVVERFSQKEYLVYTQTKSLFPIQSRDFSTLVSIESNVNTGTIYIASVSVQDELIPAETDNYTRGTHHLYGWVLMPLRHANNRQLMGVQVTFISHLDMGGDQKTTPLPVSTIRTLTKQIPGCLDRVQAYLLQHGCPPYIRRVAGKITTEQFDCKTKTYVIEFIAKHAPSSRQQAALQHKQRSSTSNIMSMWCTDIRVHESVFPSGFEIMTDPIDKDMIRIEYNRKGSETDGVVVGVRIYTEKEEMNGKVVKVEIRQPSGDHVADRKPTYTWNGSCSPLPLEERNHDQSAANDDNGSVGGITMAATTNKAKHKDASISTTALISHSDHMNETANIETDYFKEATVLTVKERRASNIIILTDELSFTGQQFSFIVLLLVICYYFGKFSCSCSL